MINAAVSQITIDLGVKGPSYTIASACASGTHAIGQAFQLVRTGQVPIALAGGSEACLTVGSIKCWEALRVLSADTCRPFCPPSEMGHFRPIDDVCAMSAFPPKATGSLRHAK